MRVALGIKVHSGWAAVVTIGQHDGDLVLADRRRIELVDEAWAKQPYHAAEELALEAARGVVRRGVEAAQRIGVREMRALVKRERERGNDLTTCGLLVGAPMPTWSVEDILAVHVRMHKAEGALFRDALMRAAEACGLRPVAIPEKELAKRAESHPGTTGHRVVERIAFLGKSAGPPWGRDQKDAALAAWVALQTTRNEGVSTPS